VTTTPAAGFPDASRTTPATEPPRCSEIFSSDFASSWTRVTATKPAARTRSARVPSGASAIAKAPSAPVRLSATWRESPSRMPSLAAAMTRAPATGLPASSTTRPEAADAARS